jgi:glutamate-1-semialdehyde aminotransferase
MRSVLSTASWLLGAGLTAVMGLIHLRLWLDGYREIPVIGPLFMLNAIISGVLAAALLAVPARLRRAAAITTALFTAGTLVGLILSLTIGLFGMHEILQAPLVVPTLAVEPAAVLVLLLAAVLPDRRRRPH